MLNDVVLFFSLREKSFYSGFYHFKFSSENLSDHKAKIINYLEKEVINIRNLVVQIVSKQR